ncbi:MAG: hypothetical protein ACK4UN_10345 [Limisphaerales bacterium]
MDIEEANKEFRTWGGLVAGEINNQVKSMPDRPKIVVALIKWGREHDGQNERLFKELPNYLRTAGLVAFGLPYRVTYLGFDELDSGLSQAIARIPQAIWSEGAIYIDGKVAILLHAPITEEKPTSSDTPADS